jgi:hypothetical protein
LPAAPAPAGAFVRTPAALAIGRLLARDRLDPGPDAGVASAHAENPPARLVDDLDLELVFDHAEPVEREFLGLVDCTGGDFDPVHG